MLENKWINPMHTLVPGIDGRLGYGGACLPKDVKAISKQMEKHNVVNIILNIAENIDIFLKINNCLITCKYSHNFFM